MRLRDACCATAVAAALVTGGCDGKIELDQAKSDLATVTAERDALKSQLNTAKNENTSLTAKVADLTTKMNAANPTPAKSGAHAQAAREAAGKRVAHTPPGKSKA